MEQYLTECKDVMGRMNNALEVEYRRGVVNSSCRLKILSKTKGDLDERLIDKLDEIAYFRDDDMVVEKFFSNDGYMGHLLFEEPELLGISSLQFVISWEIRNIQKAMAKNIYLRELPFWIEEPENRLYEHFLMVIRHYDKIRNQYEGAMEEFE